MLANPQPPRIHLPTGSQDCIKSAILHAIAYDVPLRYRCEPFYKSIKGQRVNLAYYPSSETADGVEFEVMNVVRIKIA